MQNVIVSRSNETVKKIRKLGERKYRYEYGEYIAEGKRWVADALKIAPQNVVAVIKSSDSDWENADFVIDSRIFAELSKTENNQGVMALMKMPALNSGESGDYCLFLDRLRDPGNMGTVIRTACACGYTDIYLRDCVDVYNPKVIRSCMTGALCVRFHSAEDPAFLRDCGYEVIAAELNGENLYSADIKSKKICLVIGNEAEGIDPVVLKHCSRFITIPMENRMESLNAAVSAGILMYQLKYANKKENL